MKKNDAMPWWGWLAWMVTAALGALAYFHLPAEVVGKGGHAAPRLLVVSYEPALTLFVILLWHGLWKIDPKRRNYGDFWPTYRYIGGVIVSCVSLTYLVVLGHVFGLGSMRLIPTAIGVMFMLIANVSPRIRPNWWVGFRTPWTLSSEESWNRTHRLAGQLGIPAGLLVVVLAWTLPLGVAMRLAILVPVLLWVATAFVASYFYAKGANRR